MAITLNDFNKIWASTSPLTPYSFSESNYKQGWNFIGSTPPARQMWDFLQKNNDEKMQYIVNNYLPLSGGTMTGAIIAPTANPEIFIKKNSDTSYIGICGGSGSAKGGAFYLYGKDWTNANKGSFLLQAHDDSSVKNFQGWADGTLTWGGNNVITSAGGTITGILNTTSNIQIGPKGAAYLELLTNQAVGELNGTANGIISYDKNRLQLGLIFWYFDPNSTKGRLYFRTYNNATGSDRKDYQFYLENEVGAARIATITDNFCYLGASNLRWKDIYSATATINTSDERLKDNIEAIPDEVLDAWGEVNWYQYQFKDSIAEKGENARLHTGAIAQRIESVFESHNLDANRYGLLCYDEWDAEEEQKDDDGNIVQEAREAGNRYSLRYEEALCMEAAYQRRRADRLEERIARLEALMRTE